MRLAEALRAYRIHNELTSRQIAESIGIRVNTYREIETGTYPRTKIKTRLIEWLTKPDIVIPPRQDAGGDNQQSA